MEVSTDNIIILADNSEITVDSFAKFIWFGLSVDSIYSIDSPLNITADSAAYMFEPIPEVQFSEEEILNAEPYGISVINSNYLENEVMVIRNYERMAGISRFLWDIRQKSNFSMTITGKSNFK